MEEHIISIYEEIKDKDLSLDQLLYEIYCRLNYDESFEVIRKNILDVLSINEYDYYTKDVNRELKEYVETSIYPMYEKNDKAHGIIHILEVIRRSFALNETLGLNLDKDMVFVIAACHDLGKYIDSDIHEKIAAKMFVEDKNMRKFFSDEEIGIIHDAIEDHRSSKEDSPRSDYGKLISSADRNTRIEMVFIRSFFVAKVRQPEAYMEDYLDFTFKRLSKRYGEENPENMFYEDMIYKVFLQDMRELLKDEVKFKEMYCEVNHIKSREHQVKDEDGELAYLKLKK